MAWHDELMQELRSGLHLYKTLLETDRRLYNLIGPQEDIEEHFADCLAPAQAFVQTAQRLSAQLGSDTPVRCVDLGTGAGLPGIPLALAFAARLKHPYQWLLLERTQKKAGFVERALHKLESALHVNLHAQVLCQDLREWKPRDEIHLVTARAFRPLNAPLLARIKAKAPHAHLLLYKGRRATLNEELSGLEATIEVVDVVSLTHPAGKERHMLVAKFCS